MRYLSCIVLLLLVNFAGADDFKLESGFKLLAEKDLSGWKQQKEGTSLDGKADAYNKRFVVQEGVLTIDPKVKGDVRIETSNAFKGDIVIRFDFKPDAKCNNDLFLRGAKFDIKKPDVKAMKEDEWNTFEIAAKGETLTFNCNGEKIKDVKTKGGPTPLGIRAEFGRIEIRHLRVKAE
jgi:hypothetical protein